MTTAKLLRSATLGLLATAGCSSSPGTVPPDGGADAGSDGGGGGGGGPTTSVRTLTTRGLLGTSTRNLLLDPFVTSDTSWGHFLGLLLPGAGTTFTTVTPGRAYVSQAPAGVTVPVGSLAAVSSVNTTSTAVQMIAPVVGGSDAFDAQVWISAGDAHGAPVAYDTAAARIVVALLPNDLPAQVYLLSPTTAPPVVLAGRQWVKLALPSPAPMTQGGWFSISVESVDVSIQVQAPEVTPTAAPGPSPPPPPIMGARRPHDRAAISAYVEISRRPPVRTAP